MKIYAVEYTGEVYSNYEPINERNCFFSTFEKAREWIRGEEKENFPECHFDILTNDLNHLWAVVSDEDNIPIFEILCYEAELDEKA